MFFSSLKSSSLLLTIVAVLLAACGGSPNTQVPAPAAYDPAVLPFDAAQSEPYLEIANPAGELPCGVFDAKGHGPKVVTLADYSACNAADYTVFCLNGQAQWVNDAISEVVVSATTVEFQSAQDGICALFPTD